MADVTLNELQCAHARNVLFVELGTIANDLADKATSAHQGSANEQNLNGDDAHGLYRQLEVIAGLLDTVGWSVLEDTAMIVEAELSTRRERAHKRQEGGEA